MAVTINGVGVCVVTLAVDPVLGFLVVVQEVQMLFCRFNLILIQEVLTKRSGDCMHIIDLISGICQAGYWIFDRITGRLRTFLLHLFYINILNFIARLNKDYIENIES